MVQLLADENFNDDIVEGVLNYNSSIVFQRVSEVGLKGQPDNVVLEWAANNDFVVVTHDVNTMIYEANLRITNGLACSGLVIAKSRMKYRTAIDELVMIGLCGDPQDFRDLVIHLPF